MQFSTLRTAFVAASTLLSAASAIPTISAVGAKFFTSDGNQFFIKGIAYQLTGNDPLVDGTQCATDAALMATTGANSIRVYHVDPTQNHDACMAAFAAKGIYVWLDLDTFSTWILPNAPYFSTQQANAFAAVMDAFQGYDNVAGFFIGNEVLDTAAQSQSALYIKAATATLKAYRDSKGYRKIPVGYSAADVPSLRPMLQNYLACGGNAAEATDFFALNSYEWCGSSTYDQSGYSGLQAMAEGYPVPIFMSETGCSVTGLSTREFGDQAAIFGPQMSGTWSGAIIYEWIQEANNYGLVNYPGGGTSGVPTPIQPEFNNLISAWSAVHPVSTPLAQYTGNMGAISTPACPAATPGGWLINGNPSLPSYGANAPAVAPQVSSPAAPSPAPVTTSSSPPPPAPTTTSMSSSSSIVSSMAPVSSTSSGAQDNVASVQTAGSASAMPTAMSGSAPSSTSAARAAVSSASTTMSGMVSSTSVAPSTSSTTGTHTNGANSIRNSAMIGSGLAAAALSLVILL